MSNPRISPPPPELLEILEDSRLNGMEEQYRGLDHGGRTLAAPVARPVEPSRFFELIHCFGEGPNSRAKWVNESNFDFLRCGNGMGFAKLEQMPRIEQSRKRPRRLPHLWFYGGWLVASPKVVDLFASRDPQGIETRPIEWVFSDAKKLDDYVFLDVVRLEYGYDYRRSQVHVEFKHGQGRRLRALGTPRPLRADIPADVHFYRDAYHRHRILVSRKLAFDIDRLIDDEIGFDDPHGAILSKKLSELYPAEVSQTVEAADAADSKEEPDPAPPPVVSGGDSEPDVHSGIGRQVMPLLDAGRFAEADEILTGWLAAQPAPWGPAARCAITNLPKDVGAFLDGFIASAAEQDNIAALYVEMNAFGINTDGWFFDIFAFSFDGGRDNYGWLGDFFAGTQEPLLITGLEALQSAYDQFDRNSAEARAGQYVADALVIARLQRLLSEATAYSHALEVPLLASAHDFGEFTVEIPRAPRSQSLLQRLRSFFAI